MFWWTMRSKLKSKDWRTIVEAEKKIVNSGARAVKPLIALLKNDSDLRWKASELLGEIGDTRAVKPLIALLEHADSDVREKAARSLGKIGDTQAVEPLVTALSDQNSGVREQAAEALGEIGDARAVGPLVEVLQNPPTKYGPSHLVAAEALGKIGGTGDARVMGLLVPMLEDHSLYVREKVAKALKLLGWHPANNTQRALFAIGYGAWDDLLSLGEAAVEPLVTLFTTVELSHREDFVVKVVPAMGGIGDARVVKPLADIAAYGCNRHVREVAAKSLQQVLNRTVEETTSEDLHIVANLTDEYTIEHGRRLGVGIDGEGIYEEITRTALSFSEVRQLARQELNRRGEEA